MKSTLFVILLLLAPLAQAQEKPAAGPEIIFVSAPAAPDLVEMLAAPHVHAWTWKDVTGINFYTGQAVSPTPTLFGGNTVNILSDRGAFYNVTNFFRVKMGLDVSAIKPERCLGTAKEMGQNLDENVQAVANIIKAGGRVDSLDVDESLVSAIQNCGYAFDDAARKTAEWSRLVQDRLRKELGWQGRVRLIEAYPFSSVDVLVSYMFYAANDRQRNGYEPFESLDLDIDLSKVANDSSLLRDITTIRDFAHAFGMKFGVFIFGDDSSSLSEDNSRHYVETANLKLVRFKRVGVLDLADRIIVQSWARDSDKKTADMPYNVPESDPWSHTHFLSHVVECVKGTVADCTVIP